MKSITVKTTITYSKEELLAELGFSSTGDSIEVHVDTPISISLTERIIDPTRVAEALDAITLKYSK